MDEELTKLLLRDEGKPAEKPAEASLRQRMCVVYIFPSECRMLLSFTDRFQTSNAELFV